MKEPEFQVGESAFLGGRFCQGTAGVDRALARREYRWRGGERTLPWVDQGEDRGHHLEASGPPYRGSSSEREGVGGGGRRSYPQETTYDFTFP